MQGVFILRRNDLMFLKVESTISLFFYFYAQRIRINKNMRSYCHCVVKKIDGEEFNSLSISLLFSPILAIAEMHAVTRQDGTSYQCLTQAVTFWQITFFVMIIVFLYILPLIILIVLYTIIAKNLISAASKVVLNKTVDPYNARARKQVILMLGTVVLCFFLCLMPYRVLALWIIITPSELSDNVSPEKWYNLLYFSRIMLYINSAINPILYNLMSSKFRIGFCRVCFCCKRPKERIQNRRVHRTVTNGSTTSSSLTRTTNSLKKLFSHRTSLDKSDTEADSKDEKETTVKSNGFFDRMFTNRRFVRQQSAPVCYNPKTKVISRMKSEGSMLETEDKKECVETTKFIGHSNINGKNRSDIELEQSIRNHGSLRRSVLINSAKAKSVEGDPNKKFVSYQTIKVDCVVGFQKSKSVDYDFPESFV